MKFVILFQAFFFCFNLCISQQKKGFVLKGAINGLADGSKLYLRTIEDTVGSAAVKSGQFVFKGIVEGGANYYFIMGDTSVLKGPSEAIWIVNDSMQLTGEVVGWPNVTLTGSVPHEEFKALRKLQAEAKASGREVEALKEFVAAHTNSLYVPDLIMRMEPVLSLEEMNDAYTRLSEKSKRSFFGKKLHNRIMQIHESRSRSNVEFESKTIPEFNFVDINGVSRSIYKAISINKYTLIDFWASWCVPCRNAIPSIRSVYDDFKSSGFNVIGISIDKDLRKWRRSIVEDSTAWMHGVDSLQAVSKDLFGFIAIPAYILVDQKGRIIQSEFSSSKIKPKKGSGGLTLEKDLYSIVRRLFSEGN